MFYPIYPAQWFVSTNNDIPIAPGESSVWTQGLRPRPTMCPNEVQGSELENFNPRKVNIKTKGVTNFQVWKY